MVPVKENNAGASSRYNVPNLERGLRIMECLVDYPEGLSQSELASLLHYSKTSIYRITMTLLEFGYLVRNEEPKSLLLSRKLLAMGTKALCDRDLMTNALDVMRLLRDEVKETVLIGTIANDEVIVLEQILGSHPFKFSIDQGTRLPLHTSAPAKAILAFLPERESEAILARLTYPGYTERTLTSTEAFRRELETVRDRGYALDRGEQLTGIHCVAAPVFDRHGYPLAGVWMTGPADRIPESQLPVIGKRVAEQVKIISSRLGYGLLEDLPTEK